MTDWIEHNGGPQPVDDDVWVGIVTPPCLNWWDIETMPAKEVGWGQKVEWSILNQHLIDAKQAEIDALRDDLETWQSVFPHVMPDRLKSDQQLADEDVAAKIDAARLEGIRLGLEAAERKLHQLADAATRPSSLILLAGGDRIRDINPDTIAREAQDMGSEKEAKDD